MLNTGLKNIFLFIQNPVNHIIYIKTIMKLKRITNSKDDDAVKLIALHEDGCCFGRLFRL